MSAIGKCLQIHTLYIPEILWNSLPEHWQELKPLIKLSDFDATHLRSRTSWIVGHENFGQLLVNAIVTVLGDKPLKHFSFEGWAVTIMDSPTTLKILTMMQGSFNSLESLELPNLAMVAEEMVEVICRFRNLTSLKMQFATLHKTSLAKLGQSGLPIQTLSLSGSVMHTDELLELVNLTHLTSLDLSHTDPALIVQGVKHLAKITTLSTLYIHTRRQDHDPMAYNHFDPEVLLDLKHLFLLHVAKWQMSEDCQYIFNTVRPNLKIVRTDIGIQVI